MVSLFIDKGSIEWSVTKPKGGSTNAVVVWHAPNITQPDHSRAPIVQVVAGDLTNSFGVHRINHLMDFPPVETTPVGKNLAANILTDLRGSIKGHQDGRFKLHFGTSDFGVSQVQTDPDPFLLHFVDQVVEDTNTVTDEINSK